MIFFDNPTSSNQPFPTARNLDTYVASDKNPLKLHRQEKKLDQ